MGQGLGLLFFEGGNGVLKDCPTPLRAGGEMVNIFRIETIQDKILMLWTSLRFRSF
jgi:hypothetical protein